MLRGTKVMIMFFVLALFVYLINVIMVDGFLYNFTSQVYVDPDSSFYTGATESRLAQILTFIPILLIGLGIGYFIFDRVFGQESQDWMG